MTPAHGARRSEEPQARREAILGALPTAHWSLARHRRRRARLTSLQVKLHDGNGRGGALAGPALVFGDVPARRHRVVIVGGGFGGLYAARSLKRADVDITLVDRENHHTFQPLLYQVATAGLNATDIAAPIRRILRRQKNASVVMGEITAIDPQRKRVRCADGEIAYDTLILATGATHSYFGHDDWAARAPGLKTIDDALAIRNRILLAFEAAEREDDPAQRAEWITFIVVGGGPTGLELAGAISEIARETLVHDFRRVEPAAARVILLEAAPRVLPAMDPSISEKAKQQAEELGVEVRTGAMVTAIDDDGVRLGDERIRARTVLWAAGVSASPLGRSLGVPLDRAGRVKVEPDLTAPGLPDVFVIGDLALVMQDGKPVPGVAAAAIQEGKHTARNIERRLAGKPTLPFRYEDRGTMATIGRAAAVADLGWIKLSGFLAWLAWLFIHVVYLVGFRNRFSVLLEWAWLYVTFERGARLVTRGRPNSPLEPAPRPREPAREEARAAPLPPAH
jgi:NADH dehydrogenase